MARRKTKQQGDSLDLLLDTMCNAFGGIVLIAILVVTLIQKPGEQGGRPGGLNQDNLRDIEEKMKEWTELEPELTKAESDMDKMGDLVALILERDRLAALLEERQRMGNQSMIDLIKLLEKLVKDRDTSKAEASGLEKDVASLEEKLKDLLRQLAEIENQTKDLVNANKQELRPPKAEASTGQQVVFIVRYDEVFPVQLLEFGPSGALSNFPNNTQSIRWEGVAAHAIQGNGLKIDTDKAKIKTLIEQMKRHNEVATDPNLKMNAALIVYADSFDRVGEFRQIIQQVGGVKEGWMPYLDSQVLRVGAGGSTVDTQ